MTVGLIGYGRFGSLAARYIARKTDVVVFDRSGVEPAPRSRRIRVGTLAEAASCRVVVLATPVSALRATIRKIATMVRPDALVLDVCAVKAAPIRWMKEMLPPGTSIVGTHPLFGPDSVNRSLRGHRIVLCPVRAAKSQTEMILALLRESGLDVMIMTPALHDRMVAETIFLTQYVGRWVKEARLRRWPHSTLTYDRLMEVVRVAEHDTPELFADMWKYNKHARALARKLGGSASRVRRGLTGPG